MDFNLKCFQCGESIGSSSGHFCLPKAPCTPVKHFYVSTGLPVEPELVERDLSCPTCQRFFCKVKVPRDTPITAICEGCLREGR